jgi:hypothetical protein
MGHAVLLLSVVNLRQEYDHLLSSSQLVSAGDCDLLGDKFSHCHWMYTFLVGTEKRPEIGWIGFMVF